MPAPIFPTRHRRNKHCRYCGRMFHAPPEPCELLDKLCPRCLALMAAATESVARFEAAGGVVQVSDHAWVIVANLPKRESDAA